jgi:large subunit ribosomal protein L32
MAHPKRKISKTRRDKRRTHYKATVANHTCPITGEAHLYHRDWHEGKMYWRQVVIDKSVLLLNTFFVNDIRTLIMRVFFIVYNFNSNKVLNQ